MDQSSSKTKRAKTRLVLVLGLLSILIGQMRASERRQLPPNAYIRPDRPSRFTIRRGKGLTVDVVNAKMNSTLSETFLEIRAPIPGLMPGDLIQRQDVTSL